MNLLKDIKNCIGFLTRLPVQSSITSYDDLAKKMWLFPIVGFIIGIISSSMALLLFKFLPSLLAGFIILGLLMFLTGGHHTDGLIDFGDGLMAIGTPEHKIDVMHDVAIGTGGFILGFIVLSLTGIAISYLTELIFIGLLISEIGAKFSLVAACSLGSSAKTKTADPFIQLNKKIHMLISLILSFILLYLTIILNFICLILIRSFSSLNFYFVSEKFFSPLNWIQVLIFFLIFLLGTFLPLFVILNISKRNFNGLTGDCLGALHEFSRLSILMIILIFNTINQI